MKYLKLHSITRIAGYSKHGFMTIKRGVQRRKARDGIIISTSTRHAGGPCLILGPGMTEICTIARRVI